FIKKYLRHSWLLLLLGYRKTQPVRFWLNVQYERIDLYYKGHPRAKKLTIIFGPPGFVVFLILLTVWIEIPSRRALRNVQNQVATEVYSADSVLIGRYYIQDRTEIKYEDIAPVVIDALVSTEDARFYDHSGVDFRSLGRVLVKSVFMQDEASGGGSTITQQLAKNLYPRKHYWFFTMLINKLREAITAQRIEGIYDKKQIIAMYLNTIPFADNAFGIQTAALRFYSKSASELTTDQAAVLIGMLKATHSYNPRLFPDRALKRRNVVLTRMVRYKTLPQAKADSLKGLPIDLQYSNISHHEGLAPYFREYLKAELLKWCEDHEKEDGSPYNIYTDGLKVYTTIDSKLQSYAENAVTQQMTKLQKIFFDHWGKEKPWVGKEKVLEDAIHRTARYKQLHEQGLTEEEIMEELQKPIPMKVFTWQGPKDEVISPVDSVIHHLQYLNAGFVAIEPESGKIKAWVGGTDHDFFQYDHVKTTTKRQVGSIFKPLVYAMAIEKGISPCEFTPASQQTYIDKEGKLWTPKNMGGDYEVEYTMRGALAYSVNTVAAKMIQKAGVESTMKLAHDMGITSEIPDVPSIALGSTSISLLEMTTAYSTIANEGIPVSPYYISSIQDLDGKTYSDFKPKKSITPVLSQRTIQLITRLLQTVVQEGTASPIRWQYGVYNDMGGKTGTTQANADGWFMAMSPKLVMGAWVGADDPRIRFRSTKLGQGSTTALPITGYFMQQVTKDRAYKEIIAAKFPTLPVALQSELDCDFYELSDTLMYKIETSLFKRDSLILADTLAKVPDETFLQMLYRRKMRIRDAKLQKDTANITKLEIVN
ncbi:MAG TPA: transglycosylase domain-containing protein, partial [Cyclobacteriaceae bacterium]